MKWAHVSKGEYKYLAGLQVVLKSILKALAPLAQIALLVMFAILIFDLNSIFAALSNEKQKNTLNNETNEAFKSYSIDIQDWIKNMTISNIVGI